MIVYDSVSQVLGPAARVKNNKQYNIRLLGVPSLVYPSFAAIPLCIASQLALSASVFLLRFASNSGKNVMKPKKTKHGFTALRHVNQKKWSSQHSRRGSQVEYHKHGGDLFFDCEECVHQELVPPGHTVDSITTGRCCIA